MGIWQNYGKVRLDVPFTPIFWSILYHSYHLLVFLRKRLAEGRITEDHVVYVREDIRKELQTIWALSWFLCTDLTERNAPKMYASDSSLEGYAFVETEVRRRWLSAEHVARLMHKKEWCLKRHRWFRRPIKNVLNREVCAFRKAAI